MQIAENFNYSLKLYNSIMEFALINSYRYLITMNLSRPVQFLLKYCLLVDFIWSQFFHSFDKWQYFLAYFISYKKIPAFDFLIKPSIMQECTGLYLYCFLYYLAWCWHMPQKWMAIMCISAHTKIATCSTETLWSEITCLQIMQN